MEHPVVPPALETVERQPRPAFRLDLMTDAEIRLFSRVLGPAMSDVGDGAAAEDPALNTLGFVLEDSLTAFGRDYPERAVPLFRSLLASDVEAELDAASLMAPGIATHDLELAVDGLLATQFAHRRDLQGAELAMIVLERLGDGLSPEQRTWFDAKLALWEGRGW